MNSFNTKMKNFTGIFIEQLFLFESFNNFLPILLFKLMVNFSIFAQSRNIEILISRTFVIN